MMTDLMKRLFVKSFDSAFLACNLKHFFTTIFKLRENQVLKIKENLYVE